MPAKVGAFPDILQCLWLPDPKNTDNRLVQLTGPFAFIRPGGEVIEVPKGFVSDGASVPRWAWSLVEDPFGGCLEAAIVHDWLYRNRLKPRAECDLILLEGMVALGVPLWRRQAIYWAVRVGGGFGAYGS